MLEDKQSDTKHSKKSNLVVHLIINIFSLSKTKYSNTYGEDLFNFCEGASRILTCRWGGIAPGESVSGGRVLLLF